MPSKLQILRYQAFQRQHGRCWYCRACMWLSAPSELPVVLTSTADAARLKCTAEHLRARSEGGKDTPNNIVAACAHCNHTRHKRKEPPEPLAYKADVRRRMERGAWHLPWVHERGLAIGESGSRQRLSR